MSTKLKLVSYTPEPAPTKSGLEQNCSLCPHALVKCYTKGLSDRNVTINRLVCAAQLGIQRNESTVLLLELFRPGMINIIASIRRATGVDVNFDDMLMEMQSTTMELVLHKYTIGEPNPITPFLFSKESGHLVKWARWYVSKIQRFYGRHELYDSLPADHDGDINAHSYDDISYKNHAPPRSVRGDMLSTIDEADSGDRLVENMMSIIEDGFTLNCNEYRVMKFCIQNCQETNASRLIDGLHLHLAIIMNVSRPRITRLWSRSQSKCLEQYTKLFGSREA